MAPKKRKKKKLSAEERKNRRIKNAHIRSARSIFRNMGFERVVEIAEVEIEITGQAGEFDDAFLYENILLLLEYTTSQSSDVTDHAKKKKILFSKIAANQKAFLAYLREKSSTFDKRLGDSFHEDKYIVKIVYCSLNHVPDTLKNNVDEPIYLDFPFLKYFEKLASIVKVSAMNEMLDFLQIDPANVAKNGIFPKKSQSATYDGSILPESASGFPSGYRVVSFYADAAALLSRTYVLRRDGWRGSYQAYQRMLQGPKIEAIRKTLKAEKRVFVNNLIATLPSDVYPELPNGKTADITQLSSTEAVKIRLPLRANSIGLIDGQHRLYSYYESKEDDPKIAKLRHQQNLLVTGIIYPEGTPTADAERFAATLFLSINANQTKAPTPLRQEIEVFLSPYSPTAIGRQIMQRLAKTGPLAGHVENYFFDKGKLRTSSIVSYGLGPLIKLGGEDSLFKLFVHPEKEQIAGGNSEQGREAYLQFATSAINAFLSAVKANVDGARWTPDAKVKDRLLAVTYVNSFLITLRLLIQAGHKIDFESLKIALHGLNDFEFKSYHSSQYARMAEQIYQKHFKAPAFA
ncbi:MAG: DGQHR domain-containing protein [Rhodospirillales bacterium]|nr:DGQHR domain-containing protein [Rhodospirillales bacterium]